MSDLNPDKSRGTRPWSECADDVYTHCSLRTPANGSFRSKQVKSGTRNPGSWQAKTFFPISDCILLRRAVLVAPQERFNVCMHRHAASVIPMNHKGPRFHSIYVLTTIKKGTSETISGECRRVTKSREMPSCGTDRESTAAVGINSYRLIKITVQPPLVLQCASGG
jgi:hypothetical protein